MWELPPRFSVNIKRRAVSAVRDFPKGCGIKVSNPAPPPPVAAAESASKTKDGDADAASEASSFFRIGREDPKYSNQNLGAENGVKSEPLKLPEENWYRPEAVLPVEGVKINGLVEECANGGVKSETLGMWKESADRPEAGLPVEVVKVNGHMEVEDWPVDEVKVNGHVKEADRLEMGLPVHGVKVNEHMEVDGAKVNGRMEEEPSRSKQCVNGDVKEETWSLTRFPVLKRRNVSAVRDFPVGCGSGAPKVIKKANSEVGPVDSSESKAFDNEKKAVTSADKADDEVRMNSDKGKGSAAGESLGRVDNEVRKKDVNLQETDGEAVIVKSPKVKTSDGDKKKPVVGGVSSAKKIEGEVKRNDTKQIKVKVQEASSQTTFKSPKDKRSEGEKNPLSKQREVVEGSNGISSEEMVDTEVKEREAKKIRQNAQESSSSRVKSLLKSSSSERALNDQSEKKMLVRYTPEKKLEGHGAKQVGKNLQVKESRDARTPSEIKTPDKVGKTLVGKPVSKGSIKIPQDQQNLKRSFVEEKGDESLAAYGDKVIVQALMSAENCPWRKGKKSGAIVFRSISPKVKTKMGKKMLGSNTASVSGGASASRLKNRVDVEDEEDSPPQDDGNEIALMLYNKSLEEEGDESLAALGDKVIVQALMSAENCPRRKGKKSGAIVPRSFSPKFKTKTGKKLLGGNPASVSGGASASRLKNRVGVEDEEDSPPQDDGNEMALTLSNESRELCINMTPCVPSGLVHKGASSDEAVSRNMVKRTLRIFQLICRKLVQGEEKKSKGKFLPGEEAISKDNSKTQGERVDLKAARMLKDSNQRVNQGDPIIGPVPGVEVGDEFHYRVELSIIGIHRPFQGGIDYTKKNGMLLAMSIVASGGYPDDIDSSDVLIYSGSGGNASGGGDKQAGDQKLERGNLALKNSIDARTPVRVVYGSKELVKSDYQDVKPKMVATFTYDGLYIVEKYWPERGNNNYNVFKFQLRRMPGQPEIALKEVKKTKKSKVREGLCVKDISDGKERIPICAVNTVDSDHPMPFKYITRVMYPSWYVKKPPKGCDCIDGCSDSERCACAMKNGGEIPFNFNGAIVQAKPLVYECGPSCKCPPSCHNRVSQHGLRLPLEIFKTKSRGWGVRSLYSIPSGTFVCEYIGEMLADTEAENRVNDEYLFDIGHNYDDHNLWEGLPGFIPGVQSDAASEADSELMNVGFTIDAAEYGNVGRFINHSCSPNLYAQNLLYDHDDKKVPHVMYFAVDNIPPLQELTYHYNYSIDQVRDSEGNIKKKACSCGSPECTGRLY